MIVYLEFINKTKYMVRKKTQKHTGYNCRPTFKATFTMYFQLEKEQYVPMKIKVHLLMHVNISILYCTGM